MASRLVAYALAVASLAMVPVTLASLPVYTARGLVALFLMAAVLSFADARGDL